MDIHSLWNSEDADARLMCKVKEDSVTLFFFPTKVDRNCSYRAIKLYAPPYITRFTVIGRTLCCLASQNDPRCATYKKIVIYF